MSTWKPGIVALVDSWRGDGQVALRTQRGSVRSWCVLDGTDTRGLSDDEVYNVRPVVIMELPDGARAGWPVLIDALARAKAETGLDMIFGGLIAQIKAQTEPTKPNEPTDPSVRVTDCEGDVWARIGDYWVNNKGGPSQPWDFVVSRYGPVVVSS